jgi:type II secretory ATPase GspE/PulE/Tfp pilus assembly ATPase PilB-like protein
VSNPASGKSERTPADNSAAQGTNPSGWTPNATVVSSGIDGIGLGTESTQWIGILKSDGLVNGEVLQTALDEADQDPRCTGEWLVDHGCISQRDLVLAQAESFGIPFIEPGDYRVNLENRSVIPEELARARHVFPIFVADRIITLAVDWPLDLTVLDQIRLHTGCEVDQCLAAPRELHHLIEWAYGSFQKDDGTRSSDAFAWEDILKDVADAPAVKLVTVLLDKAAGSNASDVHIDAEEQALRVRFRIDGVLREVPAPPRNLLSAIVSRIKVLAHMDIAETRRPQDGHFKLLADREELDIRVSTLPSANGEAVVLRLLHSGGHLLTLEDLGMDPGTRNAFDHLIHLPHGMLLVTGPTGSGKTTTLYSALTRLDRVRQSIITLEDPVEIRLPQIRQVGVNPKAGLTFHAGLRSILRQDPDVIMVGEIRDAETAETALQAALTGHLMLSTLHTNSAAAVPARLLDMGVPDFLVSSALVGVLAQRLCRRVCQHCARPVDDPAAVLALLPDGAAETLKSSRLIQPMGCKRCGSTGFDGRVGIFELLVVNDPMRRAILEGTDERTLLALAREDGMRLLIEDGLAKVDQGLTTVQELLRVAGRVDLKADLAGFRSSSSVKPRGVGKFEPTLTGHDQDTGFEASGYEALLSRWLQPTGIPETTRSPVSPACASGSELEN